ncbi:MAG: UDP-N-acetylmuramate dehydrogenase [Planctomycetes bacterium]|nr:UDP-N-acetylmuramate dehydrogenase [Planctomycetota bacterium]
MGVFQGFEHVVRENEPLAPFTWFRLGGAAEYFAEPTTVDELSRLVRRCDQEGIRIRLLGGGSNLLVRDAGVRGMVLHLAAAPFCEIKIDGLQARAGGGAKLAHLISRCAAAGLGGLESLAGIPGTVGGALHGNAGTQSGDIGQWTSSATVMTRSGETLTRERDDLRFAYRESSLDDLVIVDAIFTLERDDPEILTKRLQKNWIVTKAAHPTGALCAIPIFKDPEGASAASLIDKAGLRGARSGQAEVCRTNSNFIVVGNGATSQDVEQLIQVVRNKVAERTGVDLELQTEIW